MSIWIATAAESAQWFVETTENMSDNTKSTAKTLWQRLKALAEYKYEYTKLTFAEVLTNIIAMLILCFIGIFIAMIVVFFLSTALSSLLAEHVGALWSSVIVAGINLLILLLAIAFRKPLIINPVCKFVTRLIL